MLTFVCILSQFNQNFIGSDLTLPVDLYSRIKFSSTPVLNAVSFMIVAFITFAAIINFVVKRDKE